MPEISIVIPTYNRVDSLIKAIDSIIAQSYEDWELIIVDDCSTDDTKREINKMIFVEQTWSQLFLQSPQNEKIRYYRLDKNSGSPVKPRNFGVEVAKGDYIAFLDSDDTWTPNKLETQLWYMKMHGSSFSYHDLVVKKGSREFQWSKMSTCQSDRVFKFLLRKNFIPTSSVMIKRKLYLDYEGMDEKLTINHDWDLWLTIGYWNSIHFINEQLGELTIHDKGSVISANHRRRADSRKIIRKWKGFVNERYYHKILVYYYLMEVFDILPDKVQTFIRQQWYKRKGK